MRTTLLAICALCSVIVAGIMINDLIQRKKVEREIIRAVKHEELMEPVYKMREAQAKVDALREAQRKRLAGD